VGAEVRKIIYDGWPILQAVATDIHAGMHLVVYTNDVDNTLFCNRILDMGQSCCVVKRVSSYELAGTSQEWF